MFDKMTLVTAQAKEMAIEDSKAWNFLPEEDKQAYMEKSEAALKALFSDEVEVIITPGSMMGVPLDEDNIEPVGAFFLCDKCQDKGYTELEGGTIQLACDCEAVDAYREKVGLPTPPEEEYIYSITGGDNSTKWTVPEGREMKPGEYVCQQCSEEAGKVKIHREASSIGKKHKV